MLRLQLPVYSPLSPGAIAVGWKALTLGDRQAPAVVHSLIVAKFGSHDVLLTDSGTSALTLAIRGFCEVRRNPLVALPAYCCYDVATAADGADADVILYDLDPRTLGPESASLRAALESEPAALVVAHLYGIPVDLAPVIQSCAEYGVPVIEDAAQGHAALYDGKPLGALGAIGVLSFGRGKGVTGGAGGALLAPQSDGSEVLRLAAAGIADGQSGARQLLGATAQWMLGSPRMYGIPASLPFLGLGATVYREPKRPAGIARSTAAVLSRTWNAAEHEAGHRKQNARRLLPSIERSAYVDPVAPPPRGEPGYLRLPVIAAEGALATLASAQARRLGVMPGYPAALVDLPRFGDRCRNRSAGFQGARTLAERLFTLPTHSRLSAADVTQLEALLETATRGG
jgi:perosamine synthetase